MNLIAKRYELTARDIHSVEVLGEPIILSNGSKNLFFRVSFKTHDTFASYTSWSGGLNQSLNLKRLEKFFDFWCRDKDIRIVHHGLMLGFGHPTEDRFIITLGDYPCEELTYEQFKAYFATQNVI